ncbi:hypothetical protein SUGI_0735540 [Cryptomeria japonica]|nr:hypothetical protein SUGI_0735540 [Cryptomeria japonica]
MREEFEHNDNTTQSGEIEQGDTNTQTNKDKGALENQQEDLELENLKEDVSIQQTIKKTCNISPMTDTQQDVSVIEENPITNTGMIPCQDAQIEKETTETEHPLNESTLAVFNSEDPIGHINPTVLTIQNDFNLVATEAGKIYEVPEAE